MEVSEAEKINEITAKTINKIIVTGQGRKMWCIVLT